MRSQRPGMAQPRLKSEASSRGRHLRTVALAWVLVAIAAGCSEEVAVEAEVTAASRAGYVVEVRTAPELEASVSGGGKATTDAEGFARLEVPLERLAHRKNALSLQVTVRGDSLLTDIFGYGEAELPIAPGRLLELPEASHWIRVTGSARPEPTSISWSFGDAGSTNLSPDGSLAMALLAPPKASIEMLGRKVVSDAFGRAELVFSPEQARGMVDASAFFFRAEKKAKPVEVVLKPAGGEAAAIELQGQWFGYGDEKLFRPWLEQLRQNPLSGEAAAEPLLLYLDSEDKLHAAGRAGALATVDRVALGEAQPPRQMSPCSGYKARGDRGKAVATLPRRGIDEVVVVFDAHSGEQLGRRTFAARDHCPVELPAGESQLEVRPATEKVLAWAMRQ